MKWISLALAAVLMAACGGGGGYVKTEAPKNPTPAAQEEAVLQPEAADAFRDFGGDEVDPGVAFDIGFIPKGVRQHRIVIAVDEVKLLSEDPDATNGKAVLVVQKGTDQKRVMISSGSEEVVFGATIAVQKASVSYDEARHKWLPTATIVVR